MRMIFLWGKNIQDNHNTPLIIIEHPVNMHGTTYYYKYSNCTFDIRPTHKHSKTGETGRERGPI